MGLNDEIFHCNEPVLAGVDARSTYCYLLAAEQHRDGDAWATHLASACATKALTLTSSSGTRGLD